jgi:hypothetical protein
LGLFSLGEIPRRIGFVVPKRISASGWMRTPASKLPAMAPKVPTAPDPKGTS